MSEPLKLNLERDTQSYYSNGRRLVSVTEALAIAGLVDFSGINQEILDAASERGRLVHAWTAAFDLVSTDSVKEAIFDSAPTEVMTPYIDAFMQFRQDCDYVPTLVEHSMASERWGFAGTLDRYCQVNGENAIVDLKTGAAVQDWVGLQLAGYEILLKDTQNIDDHIKRYSLRLGGDGKYNLKEWRSYTDRRDFIASARVARWLIEKGRVEL